LQGNLEAGRRSGGRFGPAAWLRWWAAGLAWMLWGLTLLGVAAAAWLDQLLRQPADLS
jgi:hypothetical protein